MKKKILPENIIITNNQVSTVIGYRDLSRIPLQSVHKVLGVGKRMFQNLENYQRFSEEYYTISYKAPGWSYNESFYIPKSCCIPANIPILKIYDQLSALKVEKKNEF